MSTYYSIEQQLCKQYNLSTKWADYDEEMDEIYMTKVHPIILQKMSLCENPESTIKKFPESTIKKQTNTKNSNYHKNPFELLESE